MPDDEMRAGFADPPQVQSPIHPGISTKPAAQERRLMSSPPQQARWPPPPQGVAWMQLLIE